MTTEEKVNAVTTIAEKDQLNKDMHDAVSAFRDVADKMKNQDITSSEYLEKYDKISKDFIEQSKLIHGVLTKNETLEKKYNDLEEKFEFMSRVAHASKGKPDSYVFTDPEVKKFVEHQQNIFTGYISGTIAQEDREVQKFFSNQAVQSYSLDIKKALRTFSNIDGGFIVPQPLSNTIIEPILEISPIRQFATVLKMDSKTLTVPSLIARPRSFWVGENRPIGESKMNVGTEVLNTRKLAVLAQMTTEMIEDAMLDIESYLSRLVREEFARAEGAAFINGKNDNYEPEGLMVNTLIAETNSGDADLITFDSLKDVRKNLKDGYLSRSRYCFNGRTEVDISKIKDQTGRYIWQQGNVVAGIPGTIDNYPYFLANDMDDISANKYPVLFGDFIYYWIGDRTSVTVLRDPFSNKNIGLIDLLFQRRLAGKVMLSEAFGKIKISA